MLCTTGSVTGPPLELVVVVVVVVVVDAVAGVNTQLP
jgi:hypothetical protein